MLFSTFGCVPEPAHVLKEVASVTSDAVYFSIMAKGNLEHRISYYTSLEIPHTIDFGTETIYSSVWGESRAYSPDEIEVFCRAVGLRVQDLKLHNELAFFVVGEK